MNRIFLLSFLVIAIARQATAEIPTIHCPAEPPRVRQFQIQERWRIDAEDPDAPLLSYFSPSQVFVHNDRVYMLDGQLGNILVFSLEGEFQETFMRLGDGPGEVRRPRSMFLCSDERIAVIHGYPTMMEFVDLHGTPLGRWRLQANAWTNNIQDSPHGWFSIYGESKQSDEPGVFSTIFHVAYHDDDGHRTEEFHSEAQTYHHVQSGTIEEADEFNPWYSAIALEDGQCILAAARDEYRLEWRNLSGEVSRVVTREFPAHHRTQAELDILKFQGVSIVNDDLRFKKRKLCDRDPMIQSLEQLPDGSLLVRTSFFEKEMPPGMVCRYEVHEPGGELWERVEIYDPSGVFDVDYDNIALLDDGRVMVLRNLRHASRSAIAPLLHPKQREKMPPIPDDRVDVSFTPIFCDLVPRVENGE